MTAGVRYVVKSYDASYSQRPKKGLTAVKVTFMTMTLVTLVTAVKFDYGTVVYCTVVYPASRQQSVALFYPGYPGTLYTTFDLIIGTVVLLYCSG